MESLGGLSNTTVRGKALCQVQKTFSACITALLMDGLACTAFALPAPSIAPALICMLSCLTMLQVGRADVLLIEILAPASSQELLREEPLFTKVHPAPSKPVIDGSVEPGSMPALTHWQQGPCRQRRHLQPHVSLSVHGLGFPRPVNSCTAACFFRPGTSSGPGRERPQQHCFHLVIKLQHLAAANPAALQDNRQKGEILLGFTFQADAGQTLQAAPNASAPAAHAGPASWQPAAALTPQPDAAFSSGQSVVSRFPQII